MDLIFFFNDTATTEIYTLSLHDALPISTNNGTATAGSDYVAVNTTGLITAGNSSTTVVVAVNGDTNLEPNEDRKSTRLNSSHANISYAVFCLKKKTI